MAFLEPKDISRLAHLTSSRTLGTGHDNSLLYCGFLFKPSAADSHVNRTFPHYAAVWILQGRGSYRDEKGREWELEPGMMFQRFPHVRHSNLIDDSCPWLECFIAFGPPLFRALECMRCIDNTRPVLRPGLDPQVMARIEQLTNDLAHAPEPDLPQLLIRAQELLFTLFAMDHRGRDLDHDTAWLAEACRCLGSVLSSPARLPEIASGLGLSYDHFRKQFFRRMGMSPGTYRIRRRMDQARAMLADRRATISGIAEKLGYPDAFAFSRQFRKFTGVSPSEFRGRL